jgi:hypothetical protein
MKDAMLRIRDVYRGSCILIFFHPESRIQDPGSNKNKKRGKKITGSRIRNTGKMYLSEELSDNTEKEKAVFRILTGSGINWKIRSGSRTGKSDPRKDKVSSFQ